MKHKTSELTGALLDAAVAKAKGLPYRIELRGHPMDRNQREVCIIEGLEGMFPASTDWSVGGPIIEREAMELMPVTKGRWVASASGTDFNMAGPTPLIAAMRAYVASKLGEEVDLD